MKKLLILMSVLSLAACGGGSDGAMIPDGRPAYVDAVKKSNARVTGITTNSKYQVARFVANKLGTDAGSINLSRSAVPRNAFVSLPETGNADYDTAMNLVHLAEWLATDTTTADEIVAMYNQSEMDKNKIKAALKLLNNMRCFEGGNHGAETAACIVGRRSAFIEPLAQLKRDTEVFDINTVNFDLAGGHFSNYNQKIKFSTDEKGRIKDITLSDNPIFDGVARDGENGTFTLTNQTIYHYTIPIAETEDELFAEGMPTVAALQDNLRGQIAEYFAGNPEKIDEYNAIVDALTDETIAEAGGKQILDAAFRPELKGADIGLRYSDFGLMHVTTHFQGRDPENITEAIAGGYATKAVENIETAMHFEGKTIGSVQYRRYGDDTVADNASMPLSGRAYMDFNPSNANQQVNLEFADWYNVSADTAGNINFTEHDGMTDDARFRFSSVNPEFTDAAVNYNKPADQMNDIAGEVVINYFGDNGVASESVGYVKVGEERPGTGDYTGQNEEVLFHAGFGMKSVN